MTRINDTYISNKERAISRYVRSRHTSFNSSQFINNSNSFWFVNLLQHNKLQGALYTIAEAICLNAITINGVYRDGILDRNFEVLRETNTPAALIEIGFMSNPTEEMNIHNISFQNSISEKIADGIIDYFRNANN